MTQPQLPPQSAPPSDPGSSLFNKLWYLFFEAIKKAISLLFKLVTSGTHADRVASDARTFPLGALWFETDRSNVEYQVRIVNGGQVWVYAGGEMTGATLAALPTGLGANDSGFRFEDAQYAHVYAWSGTAWSFAIEDDHLAAQCMFSAAGATPLGGVWQVCNGATVPVSKGDGTVVNVTTPDLSGETVLMGGGPTAVRAATAPQWNGAAKTDDESTHTHAIGQVAEFVPGSGATVNLDTAANTGPGTAHHHALSNANAVLLAPSLANHGLPQNIGLVWWMRQ